MTLGFDYNPAAQIIRNTRSNDAYAYTARVNLSVTDAINGLNQVTATGATSVTHDARGNITAIGTASYGYRSDNLMTTAGSATSKGGVRSIKAVMGSREDAKGGAKELRSGWAVGPFGSSLQA